MVPAGNLKAIFDHALAAAALCACVSAVPAQQTSGVNPSHRFAPGACGPADPAYIRAADETGGVPLFLQRSEAGKAVQLMRESTRENVSTELWASAKLDGGMQKFEIPVDSVTERITFTFSVDTKGNRLALRGPDGQQIGEGSARTEDTELNCGRVITVTKPQPGMWHAEVSGSGTYWLEAQAQSDIYFISAEFVKLGGRPGHEGLFKIQGQPLAGEPATLQASVSATDAKTTDFWFVSERGDVLQKLRMKSSDADREFLEFTGDVALPSVPFRLSVSGRDTKGMQYQRFYGPLFHAESVEVVPKLKFDELAPGSTQEAQFEVRNLGPARSFKATVTDARRFVSLVEPRELVIGARQDALLRVQLAVPPGTAKGIGDDLVILVSSTSGTATTNSAVVRLTVADNTQGQPSH
jgi:hypothetical protein